MPYFRDTTSPFALDVRRRRYRTSRLSLHSAPEHYGVHMTETGTLDATRTAVMTMELQRGICGDLASFPALRDAVLTEVIDNVGRLLDHARSRELLIAHCTFSLLPDRAGTRLDLPLMAAARKNPDYLLQGSAAAELLPQLRRQPTDVFAERHHGVSPFSGTSLHTELAARGIDTLVVTGVSLNVGIPGLVIEAVNLGYSVVVARDAVAGFPADYAAAVLTNTLSAISRIQSVDEIISRM